MTRAADATQVVVERFRVHGATSCASLAFEQNGDLTAAVIDLFAGRPDPAEGQVLVRLNVDEEDLTIVYVDGPQGPSRDLATVDAAIAALVDVRTELARLQGDGR